MLGATAPYALVAVAAALAGTIRFAAPAAEPVRDVLSKHA